jgi:hypothetical protein
VDITTFSSLHALSIKVTVGREDSVTSLGISVPRISPILRANRNLIEKDTSHAGIRGAHPRPSASLLLLYISSVNMTVPGGKELWFFRDIVIVYVLHLFCNDTFVT